MLTKPKPVTEGKNNAYKIFVGWGCNRRDKSGTLIQQRAFKKWLIGM